MGLNFFYDARADLFKYLFEYIEIGLIAFHDLKLVALVLLSDMYILPPYTLCKTSK